MKSRVSIIIPVYNVEKYLEQCLNSVVVGSEVEQTEVIVIDDGSTDYSGEIADSYSKKYPFIRAIHQKNRGVAAVRNAGMDLAAGEWLYFMDSDDWLADGAISLLLKRCEQCHDSDVILFDAWKNTGSKQCGWEHFDHEMTWSNQSEIRNLQSSVLYFPISRKKTKVPLAAPWDKVYRRKFLDDHGIRFQPELKVLDDMVFNMKVFGAAKKVSYFKDKIYHYRFVPDSITNCYKADRVEQDQKVWKYIGYYMEETFKNDRWTMAEKRQLLQAFYCRVIKSFSICCRLCFFHTNNHSSLKEKIGYVKEVLETEPYRTAFRDVKMENAEWKLKVMISMGRCRFGMGIYLLHMAQDISESFGKQCHM